jgi:Ion channel/Pentapeptide repeats (8 copies)
MERDGYKFDFETQRFLKNRWKTETGRKVRDKIISGIRSSIELQSILDDFVLEHPDNIEPLDYPIYPKSEMGEGKFWLLTKDDLRGIRFSQKDFSSSLSFKDKHLSYSYFHNCNLSKTDFSFTELSYAHFDACNMEGLIVAASGGFSTYINDCILTNTCFIDSGFRDCNFRDSDFRGVYFERTLLEDIKVSYKTKFDIKLAEKWERNPDLRGSRSDMYEIRRMPADQKPDILRALRIAYERAELWSYMDSFLYEEKLSQRKYLLWPLLVKEKSVANFINWFRSCISGLLSGYSTKPHRVIIANIIVALFFAALYLRLGTPKKHTESVGALLESLYFSFTTFATLGYGDLAYDEARPYMRILSTLEALTGAVSISLFVVVLARKVFR